METIKTIGLDIAKSVFQVHGVDGGGRIVVRRRLTRSRMLPFFAKLPPCLVGIEACNNSHYWARELMALGHVVKLMPAQYVKPYVKRGKNDAADAEAICEAVTRPTMRFVAVKGPEQQSMMMLHRVRLMLNRQRTQLSNAIRAHLSEFGIVASVGRNGVDQLLKIVADPKDDRIPEDARLCLRMLVAQLTVVKQQILENDRRVLASARRTDVGRRLMDIPGIGPLLASAFVATVADPAMFRTGRDLAAWIGLVPKQNSSGGKERLGGISRAGNRYLRTNARRRRDGSDQVCTAARHQEAVAASASGASARQGRGRGAREQKRAHGLGAHEERGTLPRTFDRCGRMSSGAVSRQRGWKGH
jgi:transposase